MRGPVAVGGRRPGDSARGLLQWVLGASAAGFGAGGVRDGPGRLWPLLEFAGVGAQVTPEVSAQIRGSEGLFLLLLRKLLLPEVAGGMGFSYLLLYEAWLSYTEKEDLYKGVNRKMSKSNYSLSLKSRCTEKWSI